MKNSRALVLLFVLSFATAAFAGTGWVLTDPSGTYTNDKVGIGVTPHPWMRLRLADPGYDSPDGHGLLFFGTPTATYYGYRIDTSNDLHLDRQPLGLPWAEGMIQRRSGLIEAYSEMLINGTSRANLRLYDTTSMAAGVGGGLTFMGKSDSSGTYSLFGGIKGVKDNGTSTDKTGAVSISVSNASGTTIAEVARFATGGSTINSNVQVNGRLTGTDIAATYQDVAEWVPAIGAPDAGTVVIVSPDHRNVVMASSEAYDTRVAGVVSAKPGLILGRGGDEQVTVATTGRVKVKVDATRGAIRAGDILVSSDKPGFAMKSEPIEIHGRKFHQPGTVIGKALEPLENGTGEILVLLSMQ